MTPFFMIIFVLVGLILTSLKEGGPLGVFVLLFVCGMGIGESIALDSLKAKMKSKAPVPISRTMQNPDGTTFTEIMKDDSSE